MDNANTNSTPRGYAGTQLHIGDRVRSTAPGYTDIAGRITELDSSEGRDGLCLWTLQLMTDDGHQPRGQCELYRLEQ